MFVELLEGMTAINIILIVLGFVLVGIEMITPGFSFPGISGTVCLVLAVFLTADTIIEGAVLTLIILALLGVMLAVVLRLFVKGTIVSPIILKEEQNKDKGYISSGDLQYLLGKKGIAVTDLRPSGVGDFEGIQFDVISNGSYISKGAKIVIYKVQGSKLVVKSQ